MEIANSRAENGDRIGLVYCFYRYLVPVGSLAVTDQGAGTINCVFIINKIQMVGQTLQSFEI
jgi:hypothetical protein